MFDASYILEVLTPREEDDGTFCNRSRAVLDAGCALSIPDNPMGRPRVSALQALAGCDGDMRGGGIVLNLNTFHTKTELDSILAQAAERGIRTLLVVRGDGGPLLARLTPEEIGGSRNVVTTPDLLRYIHEGYPDRFVTGAAFNQYKPPQVELRRAREKIQAGASFLVTQPVIGDDPVVRTLFELDVTVVVEAWMSSNLDLLYASVRAEKPPHADAYHPEENLRILHRQYPGAPVYVSMLRLNQDWRSQLPLLDG